MLEAPQSSRKTVLESVSHEKHVFQLRFLVRSLHNLQNAAYNTTASIQSAFGTTIPVPQYLRFLYRFTCFDVDTQRFVGCGDFRQGNGLEKRVFREKLALELSSWDSGVLLTRDIGFGEF